MDTEGGDCPKHPGAHHVYPKSRIPRQYRFDAGPWATIDAGEIRENHALFHVIFGNRTPEEQREFVKFMFNGNDRLDPGLVKDYGEALKQVFKGALTLSEMLKALEDWDFSQEIKRRFRREVDELRARVNDKISGGIPLRKYNNKRI